jgi:acyl-CoA reductase-like NAD-dependent aldehyde dehydrogenase
MSAYNLLIDGKMVPGDLTMPVLNPATEEVLAECPRASKDQLDKAVAAAKAAYPAWAATPIEERRKLVIQIADVIEANSGELARLLTSEQGKPLGTPPARCWAWPPSSAISARSSCRCA